MRLVDECVRLEGRRACPCTNNLRSRFFCGGVELFQINSGEVTRLCV